MPANINAYIGREAAWHRLGVVTGHHMTWAEVQTNGGLDYVVFKSQLHDGLGRPVNAERSVGIGQIRPRGIIKPRFSSV
jgi:hypothetical protein